METGILNIEDRTSRLENIVLRHEERRDRTDRLFEESTKAILDAMDHMHKDLSNKIEKIATTKVSYHDFYALENRVDTLEKKGEDE